MSSGICLIIRMVSFIIWWQLHVNLIKLISVVEPESNVSRMWYEGGVMWCFGFVNENQGKTRQMILECKDVFFCMLFLHRN